MPIDVILGKPGDGKTLRMMDRLISESAKTGDKRRYLVAIGIDGILPGLADLVINDGKLWNAITAAETGPCSCHDGMRQLLAREGCDEFVGTGANKRENPEWRERMDAQAGYHEHVIPDGSLIFVDEAWKDFGHLHDASRAPTPQHVLALAEHRHRGLDFVWTTQMTNQLYPFVRGLIGSLTLIVRKFGTSMCTVYEWGEYIEDTKSQAQRDRAVSSTWLHPKKVKGTYKSATEHTITSKIPKRFFLFPLGIALIVVLGVLGFKRVFNAKGAEKENAAAVSAAKASGAAAADGGTERERKPRTVVEWARDLEPTLPGIAYTAPLFSKELKVGTHPRTLCVIYGDKGADACHCYTEQATLLDVAEPLCRNLAVHRYYDPFQPESQPAPPGDAVPLTPQQQAEAALLKSERLRGVGTAHGDA